MYSQDNIYVVGGAILVSITFLIFLLYFFNNPLKSSRETDQQAWLTKFVSLVLVMLLGVWIIDRIVAFKMTLLPPSESESIFKMIQTITLLAIGYQFNTGKKDTPL